MDLGLAIFSAFDVQPNKVDFVLYYVTFSFSETYCVAFNDAQLETHRILGRDLISDSPTFAAHISARIFLLQLTSDWNSSSSNTFDLT